MKVSKKLLLLLFAVALTSACVVEEPKDPTDEPGAGLEDFFSTPIERIQFSWDNENPYSPRGVGGGGAMSGLSFSPYSSLWFVGTDMGTLFKSVDYGQNWRAVHHSQTVFSSDLTSSVSVGFSADTNVLFHAPAGINPVRSRDAGETWQSIDLSLRFGERVLYWIGDSYHEETMLCATNQGLLLSQDKGLTWKRLDLGGESKGTYLDYKKTGTVIYHANETGIYQSTDLGASFKSFYSDDSLKIKSFAAGRDEEGITFAFVDNDGANACSDVKKYESDWGSNSINAHQTDCGYLWTGDETATFKRRNQMAGEHLAMAENNSQKIYVTGSRSWIRQYGTKVWRSEDAGATFDLVLHQLNWDVVPYEPWSPMKLEYSAPAIEQGWWDNGYESFAINRRDSEMVGGTGYFFLHVSENSGDFWTAPFTHFADSGEPDKGKKWSSTGLEVTTVYRLKFHPTNSRLAYAAIADIGGMISEDGGETFRISQAKFNSNYDYAFDPSNDNIVYAASGSSHDYPIGWRANVYVGEGGLYKSANRGKSWTRMTPNNTSFNRQFLSIGFDSSRGYLYGGTQGAGVVVSYDRGASWQYLNTGLPSSDKIISQIEVTPEGNVYALLTGDAPSFINSAKTGIYFLDVARGSNTWQLLRGSVRRPASVSTDYTLWDYPTGFAVDYSSGEETLWLIDYENNRNWLATGVWKSTDRGANWERVQQFTHPLGITIDGEDSENVYVTGQWQLDGNWGLGGAYYSNDGGLSWAKNESIPYLQNGQGMVIDPNDPSRVFYHFFGSALLYGPRPEDL